MTKPNECVIVTGSSGKIGNKFAKHLLALGFDVVGISRSDVKIETRQISGSNLKPGKFYNIQTDLLSDGAFIVIMEKLSKLDLNVVALINNARDLKNLNVDENGVAERANFLREYLLNVVIPYELTIRVYESYHSLRSVVNIGSIYGTVAMNGHLYEDGYNSAPIHYGVSKAALVHLTKELAMRFTRKKVAVNCISFGGVSGRESSDFIQRYSTLCPSGEMLKAEDLCHHISYMVDPEFKGMTGQNIIVDGGWTVW